MTRGRCICDFPDDCDGSGHINCRGCGGDFCFCAACFGHGATECEGCGNCVEHEDCDEHDNDPPLATPRTTPEDSAQ
jgi:hypothetical protein